MKIFDLFSSSLKADEKVLFFSIDPTKKFSHFHYKKKSYLISIENIKKLPKTFSALFMSPSEAIIEDEVVETESIQAVIDSYRGQIVYIQYDTEYLEELERELLKLSKVPNFYPSLSFIRRLNDGAYIEVYWLEDCEKWYLINYIIDDGQFKSRSAQTFSAGSEADIFNEIISILTPLPPETNVYVYAEKEADDLIHTIEDRFRSVGRLIEVQKLATAPWTLVPKKGLQPCTAIKAEEEKKKLYSLIAMLASIIIFCSASAIEFERYKSANDQIEDLNFQITQIQNEKQKIEKELDELAPFLAYALPKKSQPDWYELFKEISFIGSKYGKLKEMKIKKSLGSSDWSYELIYEIYDIDKFKTDLHLKKLKCKYLKRAREITSISRNKFIYKLKGTIKTKRG